MLGATAAFLAGSQGCGEFAGPSLGRESRHGVKSSETVPGSAVCGEQCAEKPYILRAQTMSSHRLLSSFFFFSLSFITCGSGGICFVPALVLNYTALEQMEGAPRI